MPLLSLKAAKLYFHFSSADGIVMLRREILGGVLLQHTTHAHIHTVMYTNEMHFLDVYFLEW